MWMYHVVNAVEVTACVVVVYVFRAAVGRVQRLWAVCWVWPGVGAMCGRGVC